MAYFLPRPQAPLQERKEKQAGALGLMRRERIATTISQLHGHRAQRSHNSMDTALKKGATPGDETGLSSYRDMAVSKECSSRSATYLRNSFSYSGGVRWNSLPQTLRQAESLSNFRSLLNNITTVSNKARHSWKTGCFYVNN